MISCDVFSEIAGRAWLSHNSELNGINGKALGERLFSHPGLGEDATSSCTDGMGRT